MIKRIELVIQSQNLTPSQFADRIGIQRSGLSHILSGRNNPSLDFVQKVLVAFPDLNPAWFLQGKGRMYVNLSVHEETQKTDGLLSVTMPSVPVPVLENSGTDSTAAEQQEEVAQEEPVGQNMMPDMPPFSLAERKNGGVKKILLFYEDGTFEEYFPRA